MEIPRILIVDDQPFNVDYLEQELEQEGLPGAHRLQRAGGAQEVYSGHPDLVLLDIMMPVMDGFEVLKRMKSDPKTRDIPVIVISASNELQSSVRGIQLGAEDYLPKPFEPTLLHARIAASLEKKRLHDLEQRYLQGLERELEIGRQIQQSFLPASLPEAPGWQIAVYFKSAREVAGDFYDAFLLPDGSLVCVIGDVCGKGVGAALFMTLFRSLIRAAATSESFTSSESPQPLDHAARLGQVISFTNNYIADIHGEANMFATVFIAVFEASEGNLSYINCGNEPPLLLGPYGEITPLLPTGPVVGILPEAQFKVKTTTLQENDLLVAFTDGIPDAIDGENNSFGTPRLKECLSRRTTNPQVLLDGVIQELKQFTGDVQQFDDITILAVKRLNPRSETP